MAENDGDDWAPDLDDEANAVMRTVSRQIKLWREAAGLTQAELGSAIGYGEDMVSAVERGRRFPKPEFLDGTDRAVGAGGKLADMKQDVKEARYPKKVRDLAKLEASAVELGAYDNHHVHGLLQTEEYARALYGMRRPTYGDEEVERYVAGRMARQEIFSRRPAPTLTFVQEEVTLRRPIGGRMVLRQQLERLLEIGQLRNAVIQVMPTAIEEHGGMGGPLKVLKLKSGETLAHVEAPLFSRLVSRPKDVQLLEMRYGIIRSQALAPRESLAFIQKVLGET